MSEDAVLSANRPAYGDVATERAARLLPAQLDARRAHIATSRLVLQRKVEGPDRIHHGDTEDTEQLDNLFFSTYQDRVDRGSVCVLLTAQSTTRANLMRNLL